MQLKGDCRMLFRSLIAAACCVTVFDTVLAQPVAGTCAPSARSEYVAVWTGKEFIVWGGTDGHSLGNGARYDPASDSWRPMTMQGAPAARHSLPSLWTGSELIVWGGENEEG